MPTRTSSEPGSPERSAALDVPPDAGRASEVVSESTISLTTDQGAETGIGVYALGLLQLLRPAFPRLQLVSLDYLRTPPAVTGLVRLPETRTVRQRWEVPLVRHHNRRALARSIPVDSAIHDCGPDHAISAMYDRVVTTIHDYYPRRPSWTSLGNPLILARDALAIAGYLTIPRHVRRSRSVVVPTQYVQRCLWSSARVPSTVIRHWIDTERFHLRSPADARARLGLPRDETLVLNVGVGASNKNVALLQAIAQTLPEGFRLVKVGEPLRHPSARLLQLGRLSHEAYPLLFNACDAYLHPSIEEGFGRPLIEAIASEIPVVALDTEVAREVAADVATYVSAESPLEEWLTAIREATAPKQRAEARARARRRQEVFSPAVARQQYVELYRKAFDL